MLVYTEEKVTYIELQEEIWEMKTARMLFLKKNVFWILPRITGRQII